MNWDAIGTLAELAATVAVFVTLVYLAVQVRTGNKQAELEGLRHTLDGFNQWCDLVISSRETAALLLRGRESIDDLDPVERTQFDHLHIRFLNTLESWYRHVDQTSVKDSYKDIQFENMEAAVQEWLGHPGGRAVWEHYKAAFPLIDDFVDRALVKIDAVAA